MIFERRSSFREKPVIKPALKIRIFHNRIQSKMKVFARITLLFFVILGSSRSHLPWFNQYKVDYKIHDDFYDRLFVPCEGGSGHYHFRYYNLPYHWDYRGKYLYVPKGRFAYFKRYQVQASVYDIDFHVTLKRTLVFEFAPSFVVKVQIRPFEKEEEKEQKEQCEFASDEKIEMLVKEGDDEELKSIINDVIECDTQTCKERANYLKTILNKLQIFIGFYDSNIQKLNNDIIVFKEERDVLNKEQLDLRAVQKDLQAVYKLERSLRQARNRRTFLENRKNDDLDQIQKYEVSIGALERKIQGNNWEIKRNEALVLSLEAKILEIEDQIAQGHDDIPWLQKQIEALRDQILWINKKVKDLQNDNDDLRDKIEWIRNKINELGERIEADKAEILNLDTEILNLLSSINEVNADQMKVLNRLNELSDLVNEKMNQIRRAQFQILSLEYAKNKLEAAFVDFERIIDQFWYNCWKVKVDVQEKEYGHRYYATDSAYHHYVKSIYGIEPEDDLAPVAFSGAYYGSNPWKVSYGVGPYLLRSPYTCASKVKNYRGTIVRINKDRIYVVERQSGNQYSLSIHGCSILQSVTGFSYPRIDDRVYFKAHRRPSNIESYHYDLHTLLCY